VTRCAGGSEARLCRRAGFGEVFFDDGTAGIRLRRLFERLDRDAGIAGFYKSLQRRVSVLDDAADDFLPGTGAERQAEGNRADRVHRSPFHPLLPAEVCRCISRFR
jgi:hypothetical protein